MQDDKFEPRLGRIGARDGKAERRYQQRVLKSAALLVVKKKRVVDVSQDLMHGKYI